MIEQANGVVRTEREGETGEEREGEGGRWGLHRERVGFGGNLRMKEMLRAAMAICHAAICFPLITD